MKGVKILTALLCLCILASCGASDAQSVTPESFGTRVQLRYAERFTMDDDGAGRVLVTIDGTERYLIIRDGAEIPETSKASDGAETLEASESAETSEGAKTSEASDGVTVLRLPLTGVYVAASSAMDFFRCLDALDAVRFTSTALSNWSLALVREAMKTGKLRYVGKYSAPDFETLLAERCPLAIESTMIYHSPDIREQLQTLGVPVLVERSSYETNPLGRLEWVKLYGLLTGHETEAAAFFDAQAALVERVAAAENTGKTAAFFSVSPNGYVSVRKPGDYVTKMMELAGGNYVLADSLPEADSARYTVNLQMEAFYAGARDADILIYDGAIDSGMETLEQLVGKSGLFADFKAVKNGDVWRSSRNMFQEPTAAGGVIADFHAVFTGATDDLIYLYRLS